ncbi:MAG TPA: bifunctional pyr operon transcriptional regulator/uracil phosphoribosyltransferase PyrR [Thermodesulfobacteriota bacterium]|nr:bifunctional pyr operon transcriptional regulator/uracil phosphoribosyltransferase PyrR [Thermodesulfobacteriota bacterium]
MPTRTVMDSDSVNRTISRIVNQILERNNGARELAIIGIRTRGVYIAERIASEIEKLEGIKPPLGTLDITLYRDDLRHKAEWPKVKKTEIPFTVEDKKVILVDDVIYTGRTTRAAIDEIMDYGRPSSIQLVALVDRGLRELPIQPDYAGSKLDTLSSEEVKVHLKEADGKDEVVIVTE